MGLTGPMKKGPHHEHGLTFSWMYFQLVPYAPTMYLSHYAV